MAYSHDDVFDRLRADLDANPWRSIADLADRLRIHRHTLTRVVRTKTGLHFRAWRDRCLFERSCELLRDRGTLSIKEIGSLAGFNSTRAFDRFVKRHAGVRPTELRSKTARSIAGPAVHLFVKRSAQDD